ncbi:pca operon transcription factor PcaQ [Cognatishimia sp. F0-27]|uniref:pca operon transcription factor PcaQ n=1 Tax=Cognatishimia sp. F0-27 TaxID=2816855 RepID=UPI001D0C1144|nr:pca operon transcription factor PcaQ [Cognatishimia sp. F0-27]MCC1494640.1 pca operon transcription factor PcaQ [Cognatishimia sp. F0-27]
MDRRIKFRHLDAFSTIAREHSLKRAAERLNLTQPAISRTLKDLEDILGVTLMDRSRAGVRLTDQGAVFLQFAEQSTAALRQGLRSVQADRTAPGRLRIGALPSVASGLLVRATQAFLAQHPDTILEVVEGPHEALTGQLRSGALDLVIGRLGRPETMDGLSFRQLHAEEVVVVCRADSAAAGIRQFEALSRYRVLYPPQSSAIRPLIARMLIAQGVPLFENRIETTSSSFGRAMVLCDPELVWFISRGVIADDVAAGRMVALELDMTATVGAAGIMSRSEEVPSALVRAFARTVGAVSNGAVAG